MKKNPQASSSMLAALAAALFLASAPASAILIAYEGFGYTPGADLSGQNGGSGFSGAWAPGGTGTVIGTNYDIGSGSLEYGTLQTSGNRAFSAPITTGGGVAGITRSLGASLGTPGTTYISFLLRPEGTLNQGLFNGFFGLSLEQAGNPELFAGKPGGDAIADYALEDLGGAGQVSSGIDVLINTVALLVLQAEFTDGNDTFTLFVNPVLGNPLIGGTVKNDINAGIVGGLTIISTGAFSIDEIRVGQTLADVTPTRLVTSVPEPGTWLLFLSGMAALQLGRRRTT